jgi:hypothetical protein
MGVEIGLGVEKGLLILICEVVGKGLSTWTVITRILYMSTSEKDLI